VDENSTEEVSLDKEVSISPETTHRMSVDPSMLKYLCMVISLIEGRRISMKELLEMLARIMRQQHVSYQEDRLRFELSQQTSSVRELSWWKTWN
jgi:hypothetical protein